MTTLVVIDFPYTGPWGAEMEAQMTDLAESINEEPGFIWKIWTENSEGSVAGGVYLFADKSSAEAYIEKHTRRLEGFGIANINAKMFDTNDGLTKINHGPLDAV